MSKRIIILGNGNLGKYLERYLSKLYPVTVYDRRHFDAMFFSDSEFFKRNIKSGDVVINSVGLLKPNIKSAEGAWEVNAIFPQIVQSVCESNGANFIHICSDCVFKGDKGSYLEIDDPDCSEIYGVTKSQVTEGTIIRTSFIGEHGGLLKWVLDNANGVIDGYTNCIWNGVTALELCKYIALIIDANDFWDGVQHFHTPGAISKYDLCRLISKIYGLNISINQIEATDISGTIVGIDNKLDRTLASTRRLPYVPTFEQQLKELKLYDSKQSQ
jgi:dTDP-4-dehydrorhamnose reductase